MGKPVFILRRYHCISDVTLTEMDNIVPKSLTMSIIGGIHSI